MKDGDWELTYFEPVVDEVIGPFLRRRRYRSISRPFAVEYRRKAHRVAFSYDRGWELIVSVGLAGEALVRLWRLIPDGPTEAALESWQFTDESGLRRGLERVKAVLEADEAPGWDDAAEIRSALLAQSREAAEYRAKLLRDQHLRAAQSSFEAGDYQTAIASYEAVGEHELPARDKRYLYLARQRDVSGKRGRQ